MKDTLFGFSQTTPFDVPDPVTLSDEERRRTHMLILGSPGSGKSKLLEWLIRGDIACGRGVCVIDIHGTLYKAIKQWCSYHYTLENVVLLDPSECNYVKGFNPFRPRDGLAVDVQVSGMVQALLRPWGAENTNQTPTLDRVLRLVFTAMIIRGIPLYEATYLIDFEQKQVREDVIASFTEPVIRTAWNQLQQLTKAGEWRAEVLSTENRLFRLAQSQTVKRFMGVLDPAFNLDVLDLMNQGKTLLVNLKESGHLTEENAKAFAALLLNDLFKAAIMFRDEDTLGHAPAPFYTYIDEWQTVVSPDIKKILAQARKFGLLLVLANQDLAQIDEAFSEYFVKTLMTCCQVKACFGGLNRDDALRMAREMLSGELDLTETKYEIAATKFRPTYKRDKVFGRSTHVGRGTTVSRSSTTAVAEGQSAARGDAHYAFTSDGWLQAPAGSASEGRSTTTVRATTEGRSYSVSTGSGESVTDIPMLIPEEFTEVSSKATYSLDEQLWRQSDRFMAQYQRHCIVKLPGRRTVPVHVPFVEKYSVEGEVVVEYEHDLSTVTAAKRPHEVDAMLDAQPSLIDQGHQEALGTYEFDESFFRQ